MSSIIVKALRLATIPAIAYAIYLITKAGLLAQFEEIFNHWPHP